MDKNTILIDETLHKIELLFEGEFSLIIYNSLQDLLENLVENLNLEKYQEGYEDGQAAGEKAAKKAGYDEGFEEGYEKAGKEHSEELKKYRRDIADAINDLESVCGNLENIL